MSIRVQSPDKGDKATFPFVPIQPPNRQKRYASAVFLWGGRAILSPIMASVSLNAEGGCGVSVILVVRG